jgi:flavorubredoxin
MIIYTTTQSFTNTLYYTKHLKIKNLLKTKSKINSNAFIILTYKKDEKHKGFSQLFIKAIKNQFNEKSIKKIIMDDQDYFNISFLSRTNNAQ